MTDERDDDLRERFRAVAGEDLGAAKKFSHAEINAWRAQLLKHSRRSWSAGMVVGMAAGALVMLTVGLMLGASSGYASAEVVLREHGETVPPVRPALAVLKNIPPLIFACGNAPQVANLPPHAQQGVPIIELPAPSTRSTVSQGGVLGVRQLSNGSLLVNDAKRRQISLLDSSLRLVDVVRDSAPGFASSYGARSVAMFPYLGDSVGLASYDAGSLLVMAPSGQIVHSLAPIGNEMVVGLAIERQSGTDDRGRIVYQGQLREDPALGLARAKIPDSGLIVRADLDARRIDTIARIKTSGSTKLLGREGNGPVRFSTEPNPLRDEWALLSDGNIAIVRGRDYHVDWIHPDGSMTSSPKLPFDWKRLSDEDKQHLVDSISTQVAARLGRAMAPPPAGTPQGDQTPGLRRRADAPPADRPPMPTEYVAPDLKDIFDYYPPLRQGAVKPDMDGNVWILPATSAQSKNGELVYDVVNAKGNFHRVRVPLGRSIVGFGKGGIVYLQSGDVTNGFYIEKVRVPSK